jgi:hypothetical protein
MIFHTFTLYFDIIITWNTKAVTIFSPKSSNDYTPLPLQ